MDSETKPPGRPNLRHYHRINTEFDAQITACDPAQTDNQVLECKLTNLSRAGVMALCTPEMVKTLLPTGVAPGPRQSARANVRFELPLVNVQKVGIQATCDIVYLRRISRDTFHLGMSFVEFEESGQDCLNQYMDRKLHRAGS